MSVKRTLIVTALAVSVASLGWYAVNRQQSSADILTPGSRASAEARSGIIQSFQDGRLVLGSPTEAGGVVSVSIDATTRLRIAGADGRFSATDSRALIPGRLAILTLEFPDTVQPVGALDLIPIGGAE